MLKSLLQLLLSKFWSTKENAALSALGYTKDQYVSYDKNGQKNFSFVMPFDGEVIVALRSTAVGQYANIAYDGTMRFENRAVNVQQMLTVRCYCVKGHNVLFDCAIDNPQFDYVRVYKNVGNS